MYLFCEEFNSKCIFSVKKSILVVDEIMGDDVEDDNLKNVLYSLDTII